MLQCYDATTLSMAVAVGSSHTCVCFSVHRRNGILRDHANFAVFVGKTRIFGTDDLL